MKRAAPLALLAFLLAGCAGVRFSGPAALAHSDCAPPNDAVPRNGEFVVCMASTASR